MNELNINMLSEADLKELLDIRTEITKLQKRYDEIMSGSKPSLPQSTPAPAATPATITAPTQPQPAAPVSTATPISAPAAPQPAPTPKAETAPPSPAPVAPRPVLAASQPQATPRPTPPAAKVAPAPAPQTAPAVSPKKAEEGEKIKVDSSVTSNLRQALVQILTTAGKPLPFNNIYSKLQEQNVELPESKPMLVVRKLLYDKTLFDVVKGGLFQIKADLEITEDSSSPTQPATAEPAATVQPTPVPQNTAPITPKQPPITPDAQVQNVTPPKKSSSSFSARLDAILNQ